jgi:hypothetical protein
MEVMEVSVTILAGTREEPVHRRAVDRDGLLDIAPSASPGENRGAVAVKGMRLVHEKSSCSFREAFHFFSRVNLRFVKMFDVIVKGKLASNTAIACKRHAWLA